MTKTKVCITACDGATGHSIVEHLMSHGDYKDKIEAICALAIEPKSCADLGKFAKITSANFSDPKSLAEHMSKCDVVLLIPPACNEKKKMTTNMIEAVKMANVKNVVFLSTAGIDMADPKKQPRMREFIELETMLLACACEPNHCPHHFVILRAGFYMQNLILYQEQAQKEGTLPIPIGKKGKLAPVNLDDVARVAAMILAGGSEIFDTVTGQLIELTGPELLTGEQLAQKASAAVHTPIKFADISKDQANQILCCQCPEVDQYEKDLLLEFYELTKERKLARLTTLAYKALTGEKPSSAETFFKKHAHCFKKGGQ